ncbi:LysR family transcriptional regulator [Lapillicoccus sp.]|uniref:LysR family transcriptional regulator n=1 Tax=Lapillicoccus sp. TaxID=1909287 RepID=UPI0025CD3D0D|nr:LysR family transcriptional regulator [Lapillicoccus sp.]
MPARPAYAVAVEIRQLRYFVVVAEELSFTNAARRIPVAVSALSTQVRKLESELGRVLLNRTTHSVELTAAGQAFLTVAVDVLDRLDRGAAEIKLSAPTRTLRLGVVEEGLAELTGPVIDAFRAAYPLIELDVRPCTAASLFERPGEVDVLFWVHPEPPLPGWMFTPVLESDAVAVLGVGHPLAGRAQLQAREIIDSTFVGVPDQARPWFVRHYLEDQRGGPPRALSTAVVRDVPGGQGLVSLDGAVMVQPAAKLRYFNRPDIVAIPLVDIAAFPLGIAAPYGGRRAGVGDLVATARQVAATFPLPTDTRAVP